MVETRWNSAFMMLSGLLECRSIINEIESERFNTRLNYPSNARNLPTLTSKHFNFLQELCAILKKFFEETLKVANFFL